MSFKIVTRTEIGLDPIVRSSSGSPRQALGFEPWATVHQTGVDVTYRNRTDVKAEIRKIEQWAAGQGKPNEYNYIIPIFDDEFIYEYAGGFQAAHSAGENGDSIGVLFLNGNNEPMTDTQVAKFRWLVHVLQTFALLSGNCTILPHYAMPGANTGCPKNIMGNRLTELRTPWTEPAPPPPPPPPPPIPIVSTVLQTVVQPGDGWWSLARRVYGNTEVSASARALEEANGSITLRPGEVIAVPGKAVR